MSTNSLCCKHVLVCMTNRPNPEIHHSCFRIEQMENGSGKFTQYFKFYIEIHLKTEKNLTLCHAVTPVSLISKLYCVLCLALIILWVKQRDTA